MQPHVLIDTVGFTLKARVEVFALRPARIQVHWHGMPYTGGSALFYDTYVGDRISTSVDFRSSWAESLLLLPLPYLMNSHKLVHPRIDRGPAAAASARKNLFQGAVDPSRKSLLAASFNVPFKIQPDLFRCWCEVISRTEKLHLWIAGSASPNSCYLQLTDVPTRRHFAKSVTRLRMMASQRNISHRVRRSRHLTHSVTHRGADII
jgi:predicted O-linked N-acetylglucosamine transferase (SPINDLY family)